MPDAYGDGVPSWVLDSPRNEPDVELHARVDKLEKQVKSLYEMIARRDKKIKALERSVR